MTYYPATGKNSLFEAFLFFSARIRLIYQTFSRIFFLCVCVFPSPLVFHFALTRASQRPTGSAVHVMSSCTRLFPSSDFKSAKNMHLKLFIFFPLKCCAHPMPTLDPRCPHLSIDSLSLSPENHSNRSHRILFLPLRSFFFFQKFRQRGRRLLQHTSHILLLKRLGGAVKLSERQVFRYPADQYKSAQVNERNKNNKKTDGPPKLLIAHRVAVIVVRRQNFFFWGVKDESFRFGVPRQRPAE